MTETVAPPLDRRDPGGWAPYLDEGEALLWEGAPAGRLRVRPGDLLMSVFGLFFGGFAVIWMAMAIGMGAPFFFSLFGLPFIAVGAYMVFGRFFVDAYKRRHTRYALTDRRGIIASQGFGRSLISHPIGPDTEIEYAPGPLADIWFAREIRHGQKGRTWIEKRGFEMIEDGDEVYRLMRRVKAGTA